MKAYFSLASFWLLPFLCFSQTFNTVLHIEVPNKVNIQHLNIEDVQAEKETNVDTVLGIESKSIEPDLKNDQHPIGFFARLPLNHISLTSPFGYRTHPVTGEKRKFHSGVDLASHQDTVYSILHGVVEKSGYSKLLGNYVQVNHGEYISIYGHLSTRFVLANDLVKAGSSLGITGSTGRVTGEHLHFTVKHNNKYISPLLFLANIINMNGKALLSAINTKTNNLNF